MAEVTKHGIFLEKTSNAFESKAVLNPATYQEGDTVNVFYRAVSDKDISSVGYCKTNGPTEVVKRSPKPILVPEHDYEIKGVEDPRIVKIDDAYYLTYTAFDGKNARIAYAKSYDLIHFEKQGIISANITYKEAEKLFASSHLKDRYYFFSSYMQEKAGEDILLWEKNGILFPEKINGKFAMIHRILPEMQLIYFDDFEQLKDRDFWTEHLSNLAEHVIIENTEWYETRNIGAGAPPIKTEAGWLLIYHAVRELNVRRTYSVSAIMLDLDDPSKVVGKLKNPLFSPTEDWEKDSIEGKHVVFPSGTSIFNNKLYIYYGAADSRIGVASVEMDNFLRDLIKSEETICR
jgi:predicted GH43/DUF377 family glycosyl hydrolase